MDAPTEGPQPRDLLAAERTYLAWIRTALAFVAAGIAVVPLLPPLGIPGARRTLGAALAAGGGGLAVAAHRRYAESRRRLSAGEPLPATRLPLALAVGSVAVAAVVVLLSTTSPAFS